MGDEQDSWFKTAFGVDPGQALQRIEASATAALNEVKAFGGQVVQGVQQAVSGVVGGGSGAGNKVAGSGAGSSGGGASGGSGSFPLSGSVGNGGQNGAGDVRAVQAALGIPADGKCGQQTIEAILAFQRTLGMSNPDGRVDAGGSTARALAGGAKPAATAPVAPADEGEGGGSLFDRAVQGVRELANDAEDLSEQLLPGTQDPVDPSAARGSLGGIGLTLTLDNLSREQIDAARRSLDAHGFTATHVRGTGTAPDHYDPVFDGKPSSIDEVVQALKVEIPPRPLQNPSAGFRTLVQERFGEVVSRAVKLAVEREERIVRDGVQVGPEVSREAATTVLKAFLERVLAAQGGKDLRVTDPVRLAGQALTLGIAGADLGVAMLLGNSSPGSPTVLANAIAKLLPPKLPRSNLDALDRIPVKETSNPLPQSLVAAVGAVFSKDIERLIKILPEVLQEKVRKAVVDAVEAALVGIVEAAMAGTQLDETAKKEIKSIVGAAIKLKANEPPLDRKQGTDGSPDARERPPTIIPVLPESPDEKIFKTPEEDLPEGLPPKPKPGGGA